jgi:vancomycin resistance protein YoaR
VKSISWSQTQVLPASISLSGLSKNKGGPTILNRAFASQIYELLWSGKVDLASRDDDTATNVQLAAAAIDLTTLRPNEVFSFNNIVGMRTAEKGYKSGLMYSQGELVEGIGGGICIVSTLLYEAALETGLRIIERHPHSGPVSYADPGRDAAVSFGWADMCFKNDTDGSLLVRAIVKDTDLIVSIYGKRTPGQMVEVVSEDYQEIPYKTFEKEDETVPEGDVVVKQKAVAGFSVATVRLIKQDGKLVKREIISRDTVLPRHKIMLVPPKSVPAEQKLTVPDAETVVEEDQATKLSGE